MLLRKERQREQARRNPGTILAIEKGCPFDTDATKTQRCISRHHPQHRKRLHRLLALERGKRKGKQQQHERKEHQAAATTTTHLLSQAGWIFRRRKIHNDSSKTQQDNSGNNATIIVDGGSRVHCVRVAHNQRRRGKGIEKDLWMVMHVRRFH